MFLDFAIKVNPSCIQGATNALNEKSIVLVLPKINLIRPLLNIILKQFSDLEFESFESSLKMAPNFMHDEQIDINLVFISNTTFHNRLINDDDTQAHFYYIVFGRLSCYTKHS